ncbi:MAG: hypothetical protein WCT01_02505 [Candidatus Shapirobacteria bacterium]
MSGQLAEVLISQVHGHNEVVVARSTFSKLRQRRGFNLGEINLSVRPLVPPSPYYPQDRLLFLTSSTVSSTDLETFAQEIDGVICRRLG